MSKAYESFRQRNFTKSHVECVRLLIDLYGPITKKIQRGSYTVLGGYEAYEEDRAEVEKEYEKQAKGPAKEAVFTKEFHQDRANEAKLIMKADKKLSDADKCRLKDKKKQEQIEAERKKLEVENKSQKDLIEQMEKSHKVQEKQFKDKLTAETQKIRKETEEKLDSLRKQFKEDSKTMLDNERKEWKRKEDNYINKLAETDKLKDRIATLESTISDIQGKLTVRKFNVKLLARKG